MARPTIELAGHFGSGLRASSNELSPCAFVGIEVIFGAVERGEATSPPEMAADIAATLELLNR